jgi:hypothetical protein
MARGRRGYRAIWFGVICARRKRRGIKGGRRDRQNSTIGTCPQTNSPMIPRARAGRWVQGVRAAVAPLLELQRVTREPCTGRLLRDPVARRREHKGQMAWIWAAVV